MGALTSYDPDPASGSQVVSGSAPEAAESNLSEALPSGAAHFSSVARREQLLIRTALNSPEMADTLPSTRKSSAGSSDFDARTSTSDEQRMVSGAHRNTAGL
jgi:hypothetical protein